MIDDLIDVVKVFWANGDVPFRSSRTSCNISGTSCWVLTLKGLSQLDETVDVRALRNDEGSIGPLDLLMEDRIWHVDLVSFDILDVSDANWDHTSGNTLRA